ncbi:putative AcnD-accessory protein PrpF [Nostocoides australiense Ben110]|uniref:Putative AcnD-accessory protein PrpF n=1 Tax=Nostocoides australiense Ben110 TaxID=1193182 RepID=W6K0A8_9MICO|nr:PrpF domain-containing protein [Tetrasphaera australiensis]CCH71759.1 putative AcnD-accessory protein PrpF [Tetrasphaera australiensis Ben110]
MRGIPATWMRGGTSKCWVFRAQDLEVPEMTVDEVLLRLYGSPDHRQVDGVGGATSTTSKAVIVAPSARDGIDVDYTFAQVGIEQAKVDWGSNCGNCSAVVAAYAVRAGWVSAQDPTTSVRVLNTNTDQVIVQELPTPGGILTEEPTTEIPGVPFPGAPVRMGFVEPAGRTTGRLFPSGNHVDELPDGDNAVIAATLIDAGAPVVAVRAADLGLTGDESPDQLDALPGMLPRLDRIRRAAAVAMGLVKTPEEAARAIPKLAIVSSPAASGTDLRVLMLSMGKAHPAVPITGSVGLTLAASRPGTLVAEVVDAGGRPRSPFAGLGLDTAAGVVSTFVTETDGQQVVGATRTYRRLAEGVLFLPDPTRTDTGDES